MSKIGKQPISIPTGVNVSFTDGILDIKGEKGSLSKKIPSNISIKLKALKLSLPLITTIPSMIELCGEHGEL